MKKTLFMTSLLAALIVQFSCNPENDPPEITYPKTFELSGYVIEETHYRLATADNFTTLPNNNPFAPVYMAGITEELDSYLPFIEPCRVTLTSETEATLHSCGGNETVAATYSVSGDEVVFTFTGDGGGQIFFTKTGDFSILKICQTALTHSYYDNVLDRVEYNLDFRECSGDDLNTLLENFHEEQDLVAGDTVVVSYLNFLFPAE